MIASFPAAPPYLRWRGSRPASGRLWLRALLALTARGAAPHDPRPNAPAPSAGSQIGGDAAESGPDAQIDALYQLHARAVLAYLCRRLPTLADAEDALADVFLAALTSRTSGAVPSLSWLIAVARRRVADFYRERERHPIAVMPFDKAASDGEPESLSLRREQQRELWKIIAQLPDEQREVLALRFAAGLRSPEIAAIIGKSGDATRAMLSRALRRIRKEWVR